MIHKQDDTTIEQRNASVVKLIQKVANIVPSFASVSDIPKDAKQLLMSTDGVGTKIALAAKYRKYNTIGQDLVAMCVNDIIAEGGIPYYFHNYIGMSRIDDVVVSIIVESIAKACSSCGVTLTGGETAELSDTYKHDYPELVGFAVGFKLRGDGTDIKKDDLLVALPSNGVHSNGFTIIRSLLGEDAYVEELLTPTKIYSEVADVYVKSPNLIKKAAHITGGGLIENIGRIVPAGNYAITDLVNIEVPEIFEFIRKLGDIPIDTMYNTFNMGIGMVLIVNKSNYNVLRRYLGFEPPIIGNIT